MRSKVCVVVPAFCEEKVIKSVIKDTLRTFKKSNLDVDIVVVDDSSTDNTADEAQKAGAIVIRHILNTGAGGATATGLSFAERNGYIAAATMDADGQHDPKDTLRGFETLFANNYDLVIGSRLINSEGMSPLKVIGNRGLSYITYLLFGIDSTDSQSGLRIFSKKSLENLRWKTSGYEFCSEMLWRAKQLDLNIGEYPIKAIYTDYSMSKGQNNWNAVNILKSLIRRRLTEFFE